MNKGDSRDADVAGGTDGAPVTSRDSAERSPSPAVGRAILILEYLAHEKPEATMSEIATALGLNKSTCFNILKSLVQSSMVVRDPRMPIYRLGPKLVELGSASRRNYSYREHVRRELQPLVEKYELACLIGQLLPNDAGIVLTDRITPSGKTVISAPVGQVHPLSVPAMGRAVLATRPFEAVTGLREILPAGAGDDEFDQLRSQLEKFRRQGFATSLEEYLEGVNAVATTVSGPDGEIALILCLMGPAEEFERDTVEEAGHELRSVAKRLELALHHNSAAYSIGRE